MGGQFTASAGFNNLTNGYFVPELFSLKLQAKYYASTCIADICNHDWEGEIKGKGDTVNIRVRPDITINDYEKGGGLTYQDIEDSRIQLLIDKGKYWAFKDDDVDRHQADINFVNECTEDAAYQMKIAIEQDLFQTVYSQVASDNQMSSTVVTKTNVLDWLVDAQVLLNEANVPESGRWAILPPWICGMVMKSELKDASVMGDAKSILRGKGALGEIAGFTVYMNNNLYAPSTTYHCLAGHPDFCSFASQFVKTELNLRLENTFGCAHRGLKVYGYKVTKDDAGVYMPATKS